MKNLTKEQRTFIPEISLNQYRKEIAIAIEKDNKEKVDELLGDVKSNYGGDNEEMLAYDFGLIN